MFQFLDLVAGEKVKSPHLLLPVAQWKTFSIAPMHSTPLHE